jgi:hypothetical protein
MNISAYGHRFFIFGGIVLVAVAVVQLLSRPRGKEGGAQIRLLDATTIRSVFFLVVGILVVLAGVGVFPLPGDK